MSSETRLRQREWIGAATGLGVAASFLSATAVLFGGISTEEASDLVAAILPTTRFLAVGVLTATITVLALLLTLLGTSLTSQFTFRERFYSRVSRITRLSTAAIIGSVSMLLLAGLPLREIGGLQEFYGLFFFVLAGGISVLGGLAISIGLMIGSTLEGLAQIGEPGKSDLLEPARGEEREPQSS